eukprot:m.137704 g.137704  ORF g.137704 m.137704 type:complete len:614 (-) comp29938_c0_seq1:710-2551(-)
MASGSESTPLMGGVSAQKSVTAVNVAAFKKAQLQPQQEEKNYKELHHHQQQPLSQSHTWLERNSPGEIPDALQRTGRFCGGILNDYRERAPYCLSDYTDGITRKTLSAALFMFCATFASTVALGDVAERETDGKVGITEYLVLQGIAGMIHAVFSGCPLPVLRPTGPITAFMVDLYLLSNNLGVGYYDLLGWVGVWVGFFLMVIACLDLSAYICLCTRFLHDIYAVFVCTIYISDGIIGVLDRYTKVSWDNAFFAYYLAMTVIVVALVLNYINSTNIFTKTIRAIITDYSLVIAILFAVILSYSTDNIEVSRLHLPRDFEPTLNMYERMNNNNTNTFGNSTEFGRQWFQGPQGPAWIPFVGLLASVPIVALFFFDQLFSCILGQKQELGITRGQYYHSSFFIIGICNFVFPMFGCPFVTASLPHSPQFVKALTTHDPQTGKIVKVNENRIAPLLVYALCFLALGVPGALELCPEGVINGILTFVGVAGILPGTGNQFIDRVVLFITHPSNFPNDKLYTRNMSVPKMHMFTLIQLLCLGACWGMRYTGDFALAFPLVIVLFVPLRLKILPRWFSPEELEALDSEQTFTSEEMIDAAADDVTNDQPQKSSYNSLA